MLLVVEEREEGRPLRELEHRQRRRVVLERRRRELDERRDALGLGDGRRLAHELDRDREHLLGVGEGLRVHREGEGEEGLEEVEGVGELHPVVRLLHERLARLGERDEDRRLRRLAGGRRRRAHAVHHAGEEGARVGARREPSDVLEVDLQRRLVVLDGEDLNGASGGGRLSGRARAAGGRAGGGGGRAAGARRAGGGVGARLDDALHEVLLCDGVLAVDHLLEHLGQHRLLVHLQRHALEAREAEEVRPHQDAQLEPLALALLALAHRPLVLHPHPQLVHLGEVRDDERHRLRRRAARPLVLRAGVGQLVLRRLRQVVAQEEPAHRVLHAAAHLDHVLQDVLRRRLLARDVHRAHREQQVQPGEHVARALHQLVQLEHLPPVGLLRLEELLEVAQLLRHLDVQVVVVARAEQRRAQLAEHRRRRLHRVLGLVRVERPLHVEGLLLRHLLRLAQTLLLIVVRHRRGSAQNRAGGAAAGSEEGLGDDDDGY